MMTPNQQATVHCQSKKVTNISQGSDNKAETKFLTYNNNNNIDICIAPYGRNFRGAGPGSVLVGVRRGKRVSLREEKCL